MLSSHVKPYPIWGQRELPNVAILYLLYRSNPPHPPFHLLTFLFIWRKKRLEYAWEILCIQKYYIIHNVSWGKLESINNHFRSLTYCGYIYNCTSLSLSLVDNHTTVTVKLKPVPSTVETSLGPWQSPRRNLVVGGGVQKTVFGKITHATQVAYSIILILIFFIFFIFFI